MLKRIRSSLNSILAFGLMLVLLVSFAIWGVGNIFTNRGVNVMTAGKIEVSLSQFMRDFQSRVRTLQVQFGGNFTTEDAIRLGLHQQILSEKLSAALIDEQARALGLRGTAERTRAKIREMEAFEGLLGGFDTTAYRTALARAGYTTTEFESQIFRELARDQLLTGLQASKPIPRLYVDTLYVHRKEQRQAEILTIPASSIGGIANPDEEALVTYHQNFSGQFMAPEYRTFNYLVVEAGDLAEELKITEEDLLAEYERRVDEFQEVDSRGIEVVTLENEEQAADFITRTNAGENFAAVATDMTDFTTEELAMGNQSYFDLETGFSELAAERVFQLGLGEVSEPISTLFGFFVFHVTSINEGNARPFADVREELLNEMATDRGRGALFDIADRIEDEISRGALLEDVGVTLGLDIQKVAAADRNGVGPDGQLVATDRLSIALPEAFQSEPGLEPQLLETPNGGYYVVEVDSITPAAVRPFEGVRDQVREIWINEERLKVARMRADDALARAQAGAPLATLAAETGGAFFQAPVLQRDNLRGQGGVSVSVGNLIFSLAKGETGMEQASTGDGYILARVTGIIPGVPDRTSPEYLSLVTRLENEFASDVMGQYQFAARDSVTFSVNDELIISTFTVDGIVLPGVQNNMF